MNRKKFHEFVSKGPEHVCTSCSQVFFRHSVILMKITNYPRFTLLTYCIKGIKSVDNREYICMQCNDYLKKCKIPPCSVGNNLSFPDIPNELTGLTQLEQLLISPRIPFMQIRELPRGGQLGINGNVVNVPADVNKTVRVIPRNRSETETIPVKLKKSLNFKSRIAFEQVRPEKIIKAAKWLISHSNLFQNKDIEVNEQWASDCNSDITRKNLPCEIDKDNETILCEEDEAEDCVGKFDTVLHPSDFREFNRILNIAPAEGNSPLSIFQDAF